MDGEGEIARWTAKIDEEEEPLSDEEVDDPPEGTVAIKLSKRTKMNIRAKWAHSLIVKVFGQTWHAPRLLFGLDFWGLPIEFYDLEVLKEIGQAIGPVLQIDASTAGGTRGRYARLCVQVDLDAPLPRSILIGRFRQNILYEGIGSLCFSCGRLGHRKNLCPYTVKEVEVERDNADMSEQRKQDDEVAKSTNPDGQVVGEERADYALGYLCVSNHDLGVVRQGASSSMKPHISINARKQSSGFSAADRPGMVRMGNPLVEIPNRHSISGRRDDLGGTFNPRFQTTLDSLMSKYNPSLVIVTETHVDGVRAKDDQLPFDGVIHTDTIGYAGGLWLLWNPRFAERKLLWENLSKVSGLHNLAWTMRGDFNEVLSSADKCGGNPINMRRAQIFKECLDECNLINLGFQGSKYTWVNKQEIGHFIQEWLDRAFANQDWVNLYPKASITHLTRVHSDHCPILLCLDKPPSLRLTRLFRFQPIWMSHPLFTNLLSENWTSDLSLSTNLIKFTEAVKIWNKEVFGNIFHRKRRVEAHGDRNTTCFHTSALVRRKRNRISCLKDSTGNLTRNGENIASVIKEGYISLFTTCKVSAPISIWNVASWTNRLSGEDGEIINGRVIGKEVKDGLWSMKQFKASGPDGMHAGFY
ncbi:uncharacterized protein LOC142620669 [Castanea sativa]|uniref:uncharacterized protein LOC142620669 n=1 Tax=Castanea sativa TaxID=21020 RepID=UPI003F64C91A